MANPIDMSNLTPLDQQIFKQMEANRQKATASTAKTVPTAKPQAARSATPSNILARSDKPLPNTSQVSPTSNNTPTDNPLSPESIAKVMQEGQKQIQEYQQMLANNYKLFQSKLDDYSKQLKDNPSPPAIASYHQIAQENAKLMPVMTAIITIGSAIFGHAKGTTMADNFSNMFNALANKNMKDYEIARQEAQDELARWKNLVQEKFDTLNTALNLAIAGKNASDLLAKEGITNIQSYTSNLMALSQLLEKQQMDFEKIKVDMLNVQARFMTAVADQTKANAYAGISTAAKENAESNRIKANAEKQKAISDKVYKLSHLGGNPIPAAAKKPTGKLNTSIPGNNPTQPSNFTK